MLLQRVGRTNLSVFSVNIVETTVNKPKLSNPLYHIDLYKVRYIFCSCRPVSRVNCNIQVRPKLWCERIKVELNARHYSTSNAGFLYEWSSCCSPRTQRGCALWQDVWPEYCSLHCCSFQWEMGPFVFAKWEDDLQLIGPEPVSPGLLCIQVKGSAHVTASSKLVVN